MTRCVGSSFQELPCPDLFVPLVFEEVDDFLDGFSLFFFREQVPGAFCFCHGGILIFGCSFGFSLNYNIIFQKVKYCIGEQRTENGEQKGNLRLPVGGKTLDSGSSPE